VRVGAAGAWWAHRCVSESLRRMKAQLGQHPSSAAQTAVIFIGWLQCGHSSGKTSPPKNGDGKRRRRCAQSASPTFLTLFFWSTALALMLEHQKASKPAPFFARLLRAALGSHQMAPRSRLPAPSCGYWAPAHQSSEPCGLAAAGSTWLYS